MLIYRRAVDLELGDIVIDNDQTKKVITRDKSIDASYVEVHLSYPYLDNPKSKIVIERYFMKKNDMLPIIPKIRDAEVKEY